MSHRSVFTFLGEKLSAALPGSNHFAWDLSKELRDQSDVVCPPSHTSQREQAHYSMHTHTSTGCTAPTHTDASRCCMDTLTDSGLMQRELFSLFFKRLLLLDSIWTNETVCSCSFLSLLDVCVSQRQQLCGQHYLFCWRTPGNIFQRAQSASEYSPAALWCGLCGLRRGGRRRKGGKMITKRKEKEEGGSLIKKTEIKSTEKVERVKWNKWEEIAWRNKGEMWGEEKIKHCEKVREGWKEREEKKQEVRETVTDCNPLISCASAGEMKKWEE